MQLTKTSKFASDVSYLLFDWIDPDPPYWLIDDCDEDFCLECAMIERGFEAPVDTGGIDGGFSLESDGYVYCHKCGKTLEFSLTNYGTEVDIATYLDDPPKFLTGDDAYHIAQILDNAPWMPELQGEAYALALIAMAAILKLPAPTQQSQ